MGKLEKIAFANNFICANFNCCPWLGILIPGNLYFYIFIINFIYFDGFILLFSEDK